MNEQEKNILSSVKKEEEDNRSLAAKLRDSHTQYIPLPYSGLIVKVRSITKEAMKGILPYLDQTAELKEGENPIGQTERSLILQEIVVPLQMVEPKVVMTEEEEKKDPDTYIWIENIPLIDRFAILGFVLGMTPEASNMIMDAAKRKQLEYFQ